jgi:putative inorganic carbon (HCO3(-)) transporter
MLKVLLCVFFMYAIYSINYWGLSQSYWYLFAGLTVAIAQIISNKPNSDLYEMGTKK